MFERLIKYLSLISIGVFTIGYFYLNEYFNFFNIDILNYISTPEVLYTLLPVAGIFTTVFYSLLQILVNRPSNDKYLEWIETILNKKRNYLLLVLIMVLAIILQDIFNKNAIVIQMHPYITFLYVVISFILITSNYAISSLKKSLPIGKIHWTLVIMLYIFLCFNAKLLGSSKAYANSKVGNQRNYCFKIKDRVFKTDMQFFVIGETQSAIFFYNKKDSTTFIVHRSEIDSLTVKSN